MNPPLSCRCGIGVGLFESLIWMSVLAERTVMLWSKLQPETITEDFFRVCGCVLILAKL